MPRGFFALHNEEIRMALPKATILTLRNGVMKPAIYSVYVFYDQTIRDIPGNDNRAAWQRHCTTSNPRRAYRKAEKLFQSHKYGRVEIKKVSFDKRTDRNVDKTLKIYDNTVNRLNGFIAVLFSVLTGALALAGLGWFAAGRDF